MKQKHKYEKVAFDVCDVSLNGIRAMSYHKTLRHSEIDKNCKCELCGNSFTSQGNLNAQRKNVHEGKRNFKYETCENSFS